MLAQLSSSRGFNQRSLLPFTFTLHSGLRFKLSSPMDSVSPTHLPSFSTTSPSPPPAKRVGTHNGSFHCDEALGCFMIRLSDKFSNAEIVRTRDPQVLEGLDAVLDVGLVYDASRDRYDHHQKGFQEDERSKSWRVPAVAVAPDRFESRKALASQWRGLRDEELSKESGIPGCVFVHLRGFVGGNQTYEGALAMARASLKL